MNCFGATSSSNDVASAPPVDQDELDEVFQLCRADQWRKVLAIVQQKPAIALTPMTMDNHITTTILHQAITSKGNTGLRAKVVTTILEATPEAAKIKNGYGSLPLHVIAQRNTKIDSQTKEKLILQLIKAYRGALTEQGGVGKRTPLHIIFTDYISPNLTRILIENGKEACFMTDKKGFLPAHVACMRHCSPEKLRMLLAVHPGSLYEKTDKGETLLSLATSTATKSHPNYALIDELNRQMQLIPQGKRMVTPPTSGLWSPSRMVSSEESDSSRGRLDSNDSDKSLPRRQFGTTPPTANNGVSTPRPFQYQYQPPFVQRSTRQRIYQDPSGSLPPHEANAAASAPSLDPVHLLLHFSRNGSSRTGAQEESPSSPLHSSQFAEV